MAFGWWRWRKPKPTMASSAALAPIDSARTSRHAFMEAARGKDRTAQARRLLAWARSERPGLQNLGQLSAALASDAQRAAIDRLQQLQYANAGGGDTTDLATVFAQGLVWRIEGESNQDSPLPPLYPFKLD